MERSSFLLSTTLLASTLVAGSASASTTYPALLRDDLSLGYLPACSLCHGDLAKEDGRVVTDFGQSMVALGMKGSDPESVHAAIRANRDGRWDSDGDGIPDVEELVRGIDPNGLALSRTAGPEFGCALVSTRRVDGAGAIAWSTLFAFWTVHRVRQARRRFRRTA